MSGSRSNPAERHLAEQHLGDRLAALVDGELGHDARERVLAHLATCPKCKTEADAQRRLKSVFAEVAPPPPSESFLARLQGLPGGGSEPPSGPRPPGSGGFATADTDSGLPPTGIFGVRPETFGYAPSGSHAAVLPGSGRGFRLHDVSRHDVGRHEAERSLWRGRRFAFAAAGAVSLAAIALGGVTTGMPADPGEPRAGSGSSSNSSGNGSSTGSNSNASPLRSPGAGAATAPDSVRRRGSNPLSVQGQRPGVLAAPVAPTQATGPLLPGVPVRGPRVQQPEPVSARHEVTAPMLTGAAIMSPLIRPVSPVTPGGASPAAAVPNLGGVASGGGAEPTHTAVASPIEGTLQGTSQIR
ncbi:zf-HC2 domain-containing protein [Streptomyces durmitorensis]|uniref:Zf-HC2 domain-containing protein n=1 Tax=Streptomyces durmitorensis TaxID=319947 RepID=A0ABY4PTD4_9ACTN|nr:zf-HC2 domain-containing protein [Streptomyces durmitorensis]UQT56464.1 zf-HC2 domain-containing protein [Streptomyces durmitorensis]